MLPILLYDNRLGDGTPTATSTAAGSSVLNLKDLRTYTFWKAVDNATQYLTVDCGSAKSADCLGIIGHNFASTGATISVECSSDNFVGDVTVALAGFTRTTDKAIVKTFASQTKRYWRLKITGGSAAGQVAVLMLGVRLQFPYPPATPFSPYKEGVETETKRGKTGHLLGTVLRYFPRAISARFIELTREFVFNSYLPFWEGHASLMKPFFFAWDLDAYPDHVLFGKVPDNAEFEAPLSRGSFVDEIKLEMEGVRE